MAREVVDIEPFELTDLSVEERLEDLPRPGAPARITADQRCQIEQLACESAGEIRSTDNALDEP